MDFETRFSRRGRFFARPGSRLKKLYQPQLDDSGHFELVEVGVEDIYDQIQSHKESVDIHVILERFVAGDTEALSRRQGNFGDFTEIPSSYAEMLNAVIAGEQYFNSLPVETRAKFGHSFQQWMIAMDKDDFAVKMGWIPPEDPSVSDSVEVITGES